MAGFVLVLCVVFIVIVVCVAGAECCSTSAESHIQEIERIGAKAREEIDQASEEYLQRVENRSD